MNVKKLISSVSALAIAASAFAGLAVTANAALTADLAIPGYIFKANYDFVSNADGLLPEAGDVRFRSGYGLFNFASGARSGSVTLPEGVSLAEGDIVVVDGYNSQTHAYSVTISGTTANTALSTSTGYLVFDAGSDLGTLTFNIGRANVIRAISIYEKDTTVATADYTIKYQDGDGKSIKADVTGNGVVGATVPVDTSDIVVEGQKYNYVSDDSASNAIAANGSTVVTITYKKAAEYSYTVKADQGDIAIASGSAFEGDTVKVAYPKYINVEGTLYSRDAENKEYNHNFTLDENNKVVTLAYTATDISNVVFLAEGEDIAGLTASNANNTKIRSSKSGAAFAAADTTITTLPAGKYVINAVVYSGSSGGANLPFALGENEFALENAGNSNWVDLSTAEFELTGDTDLVMKAGGGNAAALDLIYVVKTGDYVAPVTKYTVTLVDGETSTPTEVEANGTFTFPTPDARLGAEFGGWKLNKLGGDDVIVQGGESITVTGDASYTAVWNEVIAPVVDPTVNVEKIGVFTEDAGNPAVAFKGEVTAGTYAIEGLYWGVYNGKQYVYPANKDDYKVDVTVAADSNIVLGIVVEAATVDVNNINADLFVAG